jgi:hypothetical protein
MKPSRIQLAGLTFVFLIGCGATVAGGPVRAQDDAQPTIEALEATIAAQETAIASLSPASSPNALENVVPESSTEPIDLGGGLSITSYLLAESENDLNILVELLNESGSAIVTPSIEVSFYDSGGDFIGSESLYPNVGWVPDGGRSPFVTCCVLSGAYRVDQIGSVEFATVDNPSVSLAEADASQLEIIGVPTEGNDGTVSGQVQNNGSEPVSKITVHYATYDSAGVLVGLCYTYLDITIPAGKSANFSAGGGCGFTAYGKDASTAKDPYTYRLFVSR